MKKMFKYASLLFVSGALLMTSCGKKDDETVTPTTPAACDGVTASPKTLSFTVTAANPQAESTVKISKCDGNSKITIDMDSDNEIGYIYVLKTVDGGKATAVKLSDVVDDNGKKWTGSSNDYTLKAPENEYKKFKLTLTFAVREADQGTDAYEVWFTKKGTLSNGKFKDPQLLRVKGPLNAYFNYGTVTISTSQFTVDNVGSQGSTQPSFVVATGTGETYTRDELKATDDSIATFSAVNFQFSIMKTDLTALGTDAPALVSPDQRASLGSTGYTTGGANTTFGTSTASDFSAATEATLKTLNPSSKIQGISVGGYYSFKSISTVNGTVSTTYGIVNVVSITGTGTNRVAKLSIKVATTSVAAAVVSEVK
jgi:hypothetical protein